LGEKGGHLPLREVEMEVMGDRSSDHRSGVPAVAADKSVEENKLEPGVAATEPFDGADDISDALAALVDPAIAEDVEGVVGSGGRKGMENGRIYASGSTAADDAVFTFDPAADPLGIPKETVGAADDVFLELVALEDEIKELRPGVEGVELGKNRVFTAKTDVEFEGDG
jgi:hypothetical protein